jgi:hypothetical protein
VRDRLKRHERALANYRRAAELRYEAEAARPGRSLRRLERLRVRERRLGGALRRIRHRLGMPAPFDPIVDYGLPPDVFGGRPVRQSGRGWVACTADDIAALEARDRS